MSDLPDALKRNLKQIEIFTTTIETKAGPIKKQTVRIQVVDQQKALEMIARSLAMFQDTKITNETNIAVLIQQGVSRIKDMGRLDGHRVEAD